MSDFISVLTHGRKLQGAVKELTVEQLQEVAVKLNNIIENRIQKEAELREQEKEKLHKIEMLRQQMAEAGIDLADLSDGVAPKSTKKTGKKRPVKYTIKDADGNVTNWTGIGRMPLVFANALKAGKSLDHFKI